MSLLDIYRQKRGTAQELAGTIESGQRICTDLAAAMPAEILEAIASRCESGDLRDLRWDCSLDIQPCGLLGKEASGGILPVSWFSGAQMRKAVNEARADYFTCYYRDMPALHKEYVKTDIFLARVCPMDEKGYMYVGLNGSYSHELLQSAGKVIVEVNRNMPRAVNGPRIHVSEVAGLYESDTPLPVTKPAQLDDVSRKIAGYIAEEIPDGACVQLGIGAVPEAVGLALKEKRHLGIHTELLTDSMIELLECGAADNSRKPINTGKTVATLCFGSQRMYDYIDNNPDFLLPGVDYVNDPAVIARHPDFMSINAALEVDLYGQVCAESIGTKHVSGSGGQADYVRGAIMSRGGKSFIAFSSTGRGKDGRFSKIRPFLTPGAIVTTSRNDVDRIVTEYGVARLRGRTLGERARALISIAHPDFREELSFEARKQNIII